MQISLSEAGKRFNRDWIFRKLSYQFYSGRKYAITGPNGSGKSTLLLVIGGAIAASEGKIECKVGDKVIAEENVFRHISVAAPYLEVIEEMTLLEFLEFHKKFKPFTGGITVYDVIDLVSLTYASRKQIRYFSSGMKQRVKLAQAFFSDTACVLLDEPCTNLDEDGIALYHKLIKEYTQDRLVIISSNERQEYAFCEEEIRMGERRGEYEIVNSE
jgi:ABC-type multidrug transport system ATPase subunit